MRFLIIVVYDAIMIAGLVLVALQMHNIPLLGWVGWVLFAVFIGHCVGYTSFHIATKRTRERTWMS